MPVLDSPCADDSVPKLLRTYLAIGARICGPPAIDREFKTIDFLTLWPGTISPENSRPIPGRTLITGG